MTDTFIKWAVVLFIASALIGSAYLAVNVVSEEVRYIRRTWGTFRKWLPWNRGGEQA